MPTIGLPKQGYLLHILDLGWLKVQKFLFRFSITLIEDKIVGVEMTKKTNLSPWGAGGGCIAPWEQPQVLSVSEIFNF